ncbi:hypothetical protein GALMADRAFT_248595 [Galerina marginata CBS 339.88]|uniref:Transglutaminase-like domain-containing protein n=1 Tax=Galerina marginata (strain CBS 339.88) TaxID=685588 RepID=A0A067SY38_GALM3|nr:hypothetical protein GALMADRAFT_248595 [Galerina marginata CBS 339.88]
MSSFARPPPPRRVPPPPPLADGNGSIDQGLSFIPPPVPPRGGVGTPITASFGTNVQTASETRPPELSRLLARKPPPPPPRRSTAPPALLRTYPVPRPRNGLGSAHQTLPPPLNLSSKPVIVPYESPVTLVDIPSCLQCRDFSEVDVHATLFPRNAVRSLEDLAYALAEPFDDDIDKARVIFTWLHYNISYDAHSFLSGNVQPSTAESTLASGLAVCGGYAGLFEHLGELIGLQVHAVSGHGKGYGYQPLYEGEPIPEMTSNHAWNCILLDQEWHLVDPCWGAGVLNGTLYEAKFAPNWFTSSPLEFGRRHFPADPSFQLTAEQYSWEEYIVAPDGPNLPADFHELGYNAILVEPATKTVPDRQFVRFSISKKCEHMSTAEVDNYVLVISTRDNDFTAMAFDDNEKAWVADIFTPRDGMVTIYAVHTVADQDAKGLSVAGFNKTKGRKPMTFKGLAMWTVVHL